MVSQKSSGIARGDKFKGFSFLENEILLKIKKVVTLSKIFLQFVVFLANTGEFAGIHTGYSINNSKEMPVCPSNSLL